MSAASLTHKISAGSTKAVDAIPALVGQSTAEVRVYDEDDDYYPPNRWARIRLTTNIIFYYNP